MTTNPVTVKSGDIRIKCGNTYEEYCKILVEKLTNGFGVLTDWESDVGRRVYYTHPKHPGYEFTIRTWTGSEFGDVNYTIYREPTLSL